MIKQNFHKKHVEAYKLYNEYKKKIQISYPLKENYNPVIPLNIYQTWHTKKLPEKMFKTIKLIKNLNPRFNHQLFDDNDCREFIKNNFESNVLHAFDSLIPGAYKADLWRYCVLYKNGGIYLDIKYKPLNNFRFITMTEKEHWVLDADKNGVYNALMVCKPGNEILLKAINKIVENVKNKYYGNSSLEPTGPHLLASFFNNQEKYHFNMRHSFYSSHENRFIHFNGYLIFKSYTGYLKEHSNNKKVNHYHDLWIKKNIYNDIC
jgi:mannosyltransferase OCH1-like enzyme